MKVVKPEDFTVLLVLTSMKYCTPRAVLVFTRLSVYLLYGP